MRTEQVYLESEGIPIYTELYLPADHLPHPVVCICHGIPARPPELSDRGYPALAETICREGFAVVIFNFRGSGRSSGNFDIAGWTRDLDSVLKYIFTRPEVDKSRVGLLGFSGGAAVAVYVAARDNRVSSLISCACPAEFSFFSETNAREVIHHFRDIGVIRDVGFPESVTAWLGHFKDINPESYIKNISPRPLLILHGSSDETVPLSHAYRLYDRAGEPKTLLVIPGAGHRLREEPRAINEMISWLKRQAGRFDRQD